MATYEFIRLIIIDIATIIAFMIPMFLAIKRLLNGIKCILRSKMLDAYYANKESGKIRQYELENFMALYKAYKALKGNSFIDVIYNEVITWEVIL